jgi:hypothetical protein
MTQHAHATAPIPEATQRVAHAASWATLLWCLLLCLGCPRAISPSRGASPEAFLTTMQRRMEAGLEILYVSATVDQYHAQCLRLYPILKEALDTGYHAFQHRHERLYAAARRYVLLPAAFAPFSDPADRERIAELVTTQIPAAATRAVTNEWAGVSAAAQYVQCVFFPMDVLAGEYDVAKRAPAAVKLIQDAEDALAHERRARGKS